MLTVSQSRGILFTFYISGLLTFLPIKVDRQNGQIQMQTSKWRLLLWKLKFVALILRSIQCFFYAVWIWFFPTDIPEGHFLPLFAIMSVGCTVGSFGMYLLFIDHPEITVKIFNELLAIKGMLLVHFIILCCYTSNILFSFFGKNLN